MKRQPREKDGQLAHRVASRHDAASNPNDDDARVECGSGCRISSRDVERLLRYSDIHVDRGSVSFERESVGEITLRYRAKRKDGRRVDAQLALRVKVEDEDRVAVVYVELQKVI
jgi:hypothetical protein